jgi:hypothetical protein
MAGVERAVNLGKRLGIRVVPGSKSPPWLGDRRNVHLICFMPKRLDNLEKLFKDAGFRNEAARRWWRDEGLPDQ